MELKDDGYCFGCGMKNPEGLRIEWALDGQKSRATFVPKKAFQGFQDLVHGGILASVCDEAMGRLAWQLYGPTVVAELTVRYHQPAAVEEALQVTGEVTKSKGRLILGTAQITKPDGTKIAEATGKLFLWKSS